MPELDTKAQSLRSSGPSSIHADGDTEIASTIVCYWQQQQLRRSSKQYYILYIFFVNKIDE
jgi:hypothetical protein